VNKKKSVRKMKNRRNPLTTNLPKTGEIKIYNPLQRRAYMNQSKFKKMFTTPWAEIRGQPIDLGAPELSINRINRWIRLKTTGRETFILSQDL
jgi:hypothetical protein